MISAKETSERKQRMVVAAYELFRDKGIDNVTFGEIAKSAGLSEASVYRYFKSKSELLQETHDFLWQEITRAVKEVTTNRPDYAGCSGLEQVRRLIAAFEQVCLNHGDYLKLATDCKHYWSRRGFKVQGERYDGVVGPIITLFYCALQKGESDKSIDIQGDLATLAFLVWGVLRTYVEEVAVFDSFYQGTNRYRAHFKTLQEIILRLLSSGE